jgi:hypothetical protein
MAMMKLMGVVVAVAVGEGFDDVGDVDLSGDLHDEYKYLERG